MALEAASGPFVVLTRKCQSRHDPNCSIVWLCLCQSSILRGDAVGRSRRVSGFISRRTTSCSGCTNGSGRSKSAFTKLKIAVFAPRPRARVRTAMIVKVGRFSKLRTPTLISLNSASTSRPSMLDVIAPNTRPAASLSAKQPAG